MQLNSRQFFLLDIFGGMMVYMCGISIYMYNFTYEDKFYVALIKICSLLVLRGKLQQFEQYFTINYFLYIQKMFPLTQKVIKYQNSQFGLFLNQRSLHDKVCQLATEINLFYKDLLKNDQEEDVFTICILKGGILFFTDLVKKLRFLARPQFLYDKNVSKFLKGQETIHIKDMKDKHVLVVMNFVDKIDIVSQINELLCKLGAKTINFAVLICNAPGQQIKVACKWIGFQYNFPLKLIGYGFDKDQYFRPLNQIYNKVQNQLEQQQTSQNPEVI